MSVTASEATPTHSTVKWERKKTINYLKKILIPTLIPVCIFIKQDSFSLSLAH